MHRKKENLNRFKNKNILVIGAGKSGIGAIKALIHLGAHITVSDSRKKEAFDDVLIKYLDDNDIKMYFDEDNKLKEELSNFQMAILSPGISLESQIASELLKNKVEIIGELELAYLTSDGNFIGITGTNGKTTTTTLVGEMLKEEKRDTKVVGNIGLSAASSTVNSDRDSWFVTEVSSFQLESTKEFKPKVSAILNLTPDHLNRHHTLENYGKIKARISENQSEKDYLLINADDKLLKDIEFDTKAQIIPFSRKKNLDYGVYLKKDKIVIREQGKENEVEICSTSDINIVGKHNLENVLAAVGIAYFAGVKKESIKKAIKNFGGVEHRIEFVDEIEGIKFYNDSKGTNVDATITGIGALEKNILLIAGGDSKGQDFSELIKNFEGKVKALVLFGRDKYIIEKAGKEAGYKEIYICDDLDEATKKAFELGTREDKILISPACASWDMYNNFEERGVHFKSCVKKLKSNEGISKN